MTAEELRAEIKTQQDTTWLLMRELTRASSQELRDFGYSNKTNAEALLSCFNSACTDIEKMIRKYEKENPL
jgi:hypothetical protein